MLIMKDTHRIIYICNYNRLGDRFLNIQPSTATKVDYISRAINDAGYKLYIYSTAEIVQGCDASYLSKEVIESDVRSVYYPTVIRRKSIFDKVISKLLTIVQLYYFIFFKAKRSDSILVYHSLFLTRLVKFAARIRHINFFIEVEEVYNAVYRNCENKIHNEIQTLRGADGYICVNDMMHIKLCLTGRIVVCYGNYNTGNCRRQSDPNNDIIHIVYAGVLGEDSILAVDAASLLPSGYHLHILGYGSDKMIGFHRDYIDKNKDRGGAEITYDGCLSGEEYEDFLSGCKIALCTRKLENEYSDYTFPSKVLVYLNQNLRVVCTPINCVQKSRIAELINFTDGTAPVDIARKVLEVKLNPPIYADRKLDELHCEFVNNLKELFL